MPPYPLDCRRMQPAGLLDPMFEEFQTKALNLHIQRVGSNGTVCVNLRGDKRASPAASSKHRARAPIAPASRGVGRGVTASSGTTHLRTTRAGKTYRERS